ncbi:GGDEF domain-containing protein [Rhodobacter maris]|uniref:diguanylate cyclase n=1 Tax=Rhodobacter maris TaxID=446682 RepID=A0A285RXY8_9RHOB|nr:GGDEF domain-containing protein [Rhodobacter maris]SOB99314.1 diguanylate cyclase (GGDEF)-like protein [Rhodobacter maris]
MELSKTVAQFAVATRGLAVLVIGIVVLGIAHNFFYADQVQSASLHPLAAAGYLVVALSLLRRPHPVLTLAQALFFLIATQRLLEAGLPGWPVLVSPEIFAHWGYDLGFNGAFSPPTARALLILNGALLADRFSTPLATAIVALGWFSATGALFKFAFSLFNESIQFSAFSLAALLALLTALVLSHAESAPFRIFLAPGDLRQPFLVMLGAILALPFLSGALLSHTEDFSHHHLEGMLHVFEAMEYLLLAVVLYTGTKLNAQREKFDHALRHDPLTGALNRRGLNDAIAENQRLSGLILFDLDHFKRINDTMGHLEGDRVLRAVAERVHAELAPGDVFARWGGEEFLLLLEISNRGQLADLSERLRRAIVAMPGRADPFPQAELSASFGYGTFEPECESLAVAMARADQALQRAKEGGRNRCVAAEGPDPT